MTREEKYEVIEDLAAVLTESSTIYLTDISDMDAEESSKLRRACFGKGVTLRTVKNKLLAKAMEKVEGKNFGDMPSVLAGNTSIMISETGNVPAKVVKEFRKNSERPIFKAAYVEEAIFIGEEQLETLVSLKSKEELVADVVALLQSPAKNVISSLQSAGNTLTGLLKTLEEREA